MHRSLGLGSAENFLNFNIGKDLRLYHMPLFLAGIPVFLRSYSNQTTFFRAFDRTFRDINGQRSTGVFFGKQRFFARQMKRFILNQHLFDHHNRIADRTFGHAEVKREVGHRSIFVPILQSQKQLIARRKFRFSASLTKPLFARNYHNGKHWVKYFLFDAEKFLELLVALAKSTMPAFHDRLLGEGIETL